MDYALMQREHAEWLTRNYPNQPPEIPAAGLVEEAGELMHAALKLKQMGLWGEEGDYTQDKLQGKLVDAVGDVAVYVCSCCNANGWDYDTLVREAKCSFSAASLPMLRAAIQVVSSTVTHAAQPSRSMLRRVLIDLYWFAKDALVDFDECVTRTWAIVKQRSRTEARRPA